MANVFDILNLITLTAAFLTSFFNPFRLIFLAAAYATVFAAGLADFIFGPFFQDEAEREAMERSFHMENYLAELAARQNENSEARNSGNLNFFEHGIMCKRVRFSENTTFIPPRTQNGGTEAGPSKPLKRQLYNTSSDQASKKVTIDLLINTKGGILKNVRFSIPDEVNSNESGKGRRVSHTKHPRVLPPRNKKVSPSSKMQKRMAMLNGSLFVKSHSSFSIEFEE